MNNSTRAWGQKRTNGPELIAGKNHPEFPHVSSPGFLTSYQQAEAAPMLDLQGLCAEKRVLTIITKEYK
jgi:hypothetical protein